MGMGSKKGKVIMKVLRVQRVKIIGEAIKDPTTVKVVSRPKSAIFKLSDHHSKCILAPFFLRTQQHPCVITQLAEPRFVARLPYKACRSGNVILVKILLMELGGQLGTQHIINSSMAEDGKTSGEDPTDLHQLACIYYTVQNCYNLYIYIYVLVLLALDGKSCRHERPISQNITKQYKTFFDDTCIVLPHAEHHYKHGLGIGTEREEGGDGAVECADDEAAKF